MRSTPFQLPNRRSRAFPQVVFAEYLVSVGAARVSPWLTKPLRCIWRCRFSRERWSLRRSFGRRSLRNQRLSLRATRSIDQAPGLRASEGERFLAERCGYTHIASCSSSASFSEASNRASTSSRTASSAGSSPSSASTGPGSEPGSDAKGGNPARACRQASSAASFRLMPCSRKAARRSSPRALKSSRRPSWFNRCQLLPCRAVSRHFCFG